MNKEKAKIGFGETANLLGKALKTSLKTKSRLSLIVSIVGFAMAFAPAIISVVLQNFTNKIQVLATSGTKNIAPALMTFAILAALFLASSVFEFLQKYTQQTDTVRTIKYIKETVLKCSCDVKYKYIENYDHYKEKIAFADTFAGERASKSMQVIITWLQDIITFVSVFYILVRVNLWIVLALLVTCIPSVVLSYFQKDEDYRHNVRHMKEGGLVLQYYWYCVSPFSMEEVRHWGLLDFFKGLWLKTAGSYFKKKNKITKKHVLYNSIADVLRNVVYIVVLLIVAYEIFKNPLIGLGTFTLVYSSAGQLQNVTSKLFVNAATFFSDIYYIKDFFELEKLEREPVSAENTIIENASIEFDHVSFAYPNTSKRALDDISISINKGEKIAIVGENGSGKSTFVSLLCGMYEPDSGEIRINDEPMKNQIPKVRNSISAVFQDFGQYEATLRENITVSDKQKSMSDEELWALTRKTNSSDIIEKQPNHFDEQIGVFSKKGNNLSGGQWQKIAITRAAYRDKAQIMILDEPTAALDPIAEAQLYKDFTSLTEGKTTLLISHRLGITSIVDRILVFQDGKIIEDGNHSALIQKNGLYAKMYRAQAQWYKVNT